MTREQGVARILLRIGAVKFAGDEPFQFSSGLLSPVYCDNRLLLGYPNERDLIVDDYLDVIEEGIGWKGVDVIAGTASSGIPFAAWIAQRIDSPMVYVRPEAKKHGQGKQVEGVLASGAKTVLIEDLVSTGGSALRAAEALRAEGARCDHCISILAYNVKSAKKRFLESGIHLHSLCDFSDLLEEARDRNSLPEAKIAEVREWVEANFP